MRSHVGCLPSSCFRHLTRPIAVPLRTRLCCSKIRQICPNTSFVEHFHYIVNSTLCSRVEIHQQLVGEDQQVSPQGVCVTRRLASLPVGERAAAEPHWWWLQIEGGALDKIMQQLEANKPASATELT